jgi:glycosyltransferase involved in cell wall biosynthesis
VIVLIRSTLRKAIPDPIRIPIANRAYGLLAHLKNGYANRPRPIIWLRRSLAIDTAWVHIFAEQVRVSRIPAPAAQSDVLALAKRLLLHRPVGFVIERVLQSQIKRHLIDLDRWVPKTNSPKSLSEFTRIVHMIGTLGPGGAERQLVYTVKGLSNTGRFNTEVWCSNLEPPNNDFFVREIEQAGIKVHDVFGGSGRMDKTVCEVDPALYRAIVNTRIPRLGQVYHEIAVLYFRLIKSKPIIVHAWLDDVNVKLGVAAVLAGVPHIVLSTRSAPPWMFSFYQLYMGPLYRILANSPNVSFLANSRQGNRLYSSWLSLRRKAIEVIPNGYDFSNFISPSQRATCGQRVKDELGIVWASFVLGGVFRFSEEKRPFLWLEVAAALCARYPKLVCVVAGDGIMREEFMSKVKQMGLEQRILSLGRREDVPRLMSAFDSLLLTSRYEGLPNVLIEAQAAGVVPVATNVGGANETLSDGVTGILCSSSDPNEIGAALGELIDSPLRLAKMQAAAQQYARLQYSAETMISRTLDRYERLTKPSQT